MATSNKAIVLMIIIALSCMTIVSSQDVPGSCDNIAKLHQQCVSGDTESVPSCVCKAGIDGNMNPDEIDYDKFLKAIDDFSLTLKQSFSGLKNMVDSNKKEIDILKKDVSAYKVDCSKVDEHSYKSGSESGGVFEIFVSGQPIDVYCDLSTGDGGWTVIQRRMDGSVDFFRNHAEYVRGFGNVDGEHWIGLQNIYNILQSSKNFKLRIDMEDWDGVKKYAEYSRFDIDGDDNDYTLMASGYSGNAGDSLALQIGQKFSTKDRDLDPWSGDCANTYKGAWWYQLCHHSNLNGIYHKGGPHATFADGINWYTWKGHNYSLKFVEMKIKPIV